MNLISCRGGDPDAPRLLDTAGWLYGSRSDSKIYAWPHFIDINWQDYDWLAHWLIVHKWRPYTAMVADYERPCQKEIMLRQCDQIRALGVRPMVCPKFPAATFDAPEDAIIGVSIPTRHGGYMPEPGELAGRELHLLGGHPDQAVLAIRLYKKSTAVSWDCSAIFQKAQYGAFWNSELGDWQYTEKGTEATHDLIVKSAKNVQQYLSNPIVRNASRWARTYQRPLLGT